MKSYDEFYDGFGERLARQIEFGVALVVGQQHAVVESHLDAVVVQLALVAADLGDETLIDGLRTVLGAPRPHVVQLVLETARPVRFVLGQVGYEKYTQGASFGLRFLGTWEFFEQALRLLGRLDQHRHHAHGTASLPVLLPRDLLRH
jgi:hypothetical protein